MSHSSIYFICVSFAAAWITEFAYGACYSCRIQERRLMNPMQKFDMINTETGEVYHWSCGELEASVADLDPTSTGAPGEAYLCALAQWWTEQECACGGPSLPPLASYFTDPNPACDLCATINGVKHQFPAVPDVMKDKIAPTGFAGNQNCGGLEYAMAEGILSVRNCPIVQKNAGPICCNLPAVTKNNNSLGFRRPRPAPACGKRRQRCGARPCCGNLKCKPSASGQASVCSL
jgi:hypothetical protein